MIVKNERIHLERCLRSVKGLVDDIVVVDTGSTDGTQEIALQAGARFFHFTWVDDFSRARNHALEQARAPWILILDADEMLLERDRLALGKLVRQQQGKPPVAFNLLQNNSQDGGSTGMISRTVRVFPNAPGIRYEWPIHEQVETNLRRLGIPIKDTEVALLHDGYSDASLNLTKQRRNLSILEKQISSGETWALTYYLMAGAKLDLGDYDGAIASYQECMRRSVAGDPFLIGARVRIATCLYKQGRHAAVCEWLGDTIDPKICHPEQLLLIGNSLRALGNLRGAMTALRAVFAVADGVFIPPCNLTSAKVEAVQALAAMLNDQGDIAAAVKLMRGALSRRSAGQPLDVAWLAATIG